MSQKEISIMKSSIKARKYLPQVLETADRLNVTLIIVHNIKKLRHAVP